MCKRTSGGSYGIWLPLLEIKILKYPESIVHMEFPYAGEQHMAWLLPIDGIISKKIRDIGNHGWLDPVPDKNVDI